VTVRVGLVGCVTVRVGLVGCVTVRVGLLGCVTVRVGLLGCVTVRVGRFGCVTVRVGRFGCATLRVGLVGCATVRAGAVRTGAAFFLTCCWAVRVVVVPASFDAGAVCAIARCGICTAATTAKAAIKMMNFRISAPFSFSFFRRARCASAHGKTLWMRSNVYTDFIL